MTKKNANKSVLAFYRINRKSINKMGYQKIWDSYVAKKAENVSCSQIVSFDLPPAALADLLKDKKSKGQLLSLIQAEREAGADYVFVMPEVGVAVAGFNIERFIASLQREAIN